MMKHEMERKSQILQSGIVGVESGLIDGELITQEKVTGFQFESEATGGPGKFECGRKPKAVDVKRREWFWESVRLTCSSDVCMNKFIPTTWKRFIRTEEYRNIWRDNGGLSAYLAQFAIDELSSQMGDMIINGDYKGTRGKVAHFDGMRKLVNNAYDTSAHQVVSYTLTGTLAGGDFVWVRVGGAISLIAFDTDNATTIQAVVDYIAGLRSTVTNEPLYTVTDNNTDRITVIQNNVCDPVDVAIIATDANGVDIKCGDFTAAASGAVFTEAVVQTSKDAYAPVSMDYTVPTTTNVQDWLRDLALLIADRVDALQGHEMPDGGEVGVGDYTIIISQTLASVMAISMGLVKEASSGNVIATGISMNTPVGFGQKSGFFFHALGMRFYVDPFMRGYEFIATPHNNFWFGTDRLNSMYAISSWFDWDCQTWKYDYQGLAGMILLKPEFVISNVMTAPGVANFADPQPTVLNPRNCIERSCSPVDFGNVQDSDACEELSYDLTITENAGDWTVQVSNGSLTGDAYWEVELSDGTILTSGNDNPSFTISKDLFGQLTYRQNFDTFPTTDFGDCKPLIKSIDTETGNFEVSGERVPQTNL